MLWQACAGPCACSSATGGWDAPPILTQRPAKAMPSMPMPTIPGLRAGCGSHRPHSGGGGTAGSQRAGPGTHVRVGVRVWGMLQQNVWGWQAWQAWQLLVDSLHRTPTRAHCFARRAAALGPALKLCVLPLTRLATLHSCSLRYAVIANTGQHEGVEAPPVLLPSSLDGGAGGDQPLAGKTAGICWKVSEDLVAS